MNFNYVLRAYKGSFADSIHIKKIKIRNCQIGIVLAVDEKGEYNGEMVSLDQCAFNNVQANVINFYQGGYESTIGGILSMSNSSFTACGAKEKSGLNNPTKKMYS